MNYWFETISDNSCGPMNIEFPDYLLVQPGVGPKYLEGDAMRFTCYQNHWVHGDVEYTCTKTLLNNGREWIMQWNQGWQPWCRCKQLTELENFNVL